MERQLQAKIVTLTQRAEEAEATITCEQQQRLAYSRYISELEARVQTAEQERDELKTDKAFWELMTRDDRVTALEDELSTLLAARDRLVAQMQAEAADIFRRGDMRDDPYDDRAMEMKVRSAQLSIDANALASLGSQA